MKLYRICINSPLSTQWFTVRALNEKVIRAMYSDVGRRGKYIEEIVEVV